MTRRAGTVTRIHLDRGFGFITDDDGREVFLHKSAVEHPKRFTPALEGARVTYTLHKTGKGWRAADAAVIPGPAEE